jgi:hypothetical protein
MSKKAIAALALIFGTNVISAATRQSFADLSAIVQVIMVLLAICLIVGAIRHDVTNL